MAETVMMAAFEWLVVGGILLLVGSVVLFSLWRFEARRASDLAEMAAERARAIAALEARLAAEAEEKRRLQAQLEALQAVAQTQARQEGMLTRLQAENERLAEELEAQHQLRAQREAALAQSRERVRELETRLEEMANRHQAERALLEEARNRLSEAFEHLSSRIFEQKQQQFVQQSRAQLEALMQPWREQLAQFRQRLDELNAQQHRSVGVLQGELKQLRTLNETLAREAEALARALRRESKTQGSWGEQTLARLLEAAGLREGHEYRREVTLEDGRRVDVVIDLPEDRHIVIDAKVSLTAYVAAVNAEDETVRARHIADHVASLKRHVDVLGRKRYHDSDRVRAPLFTLMFIPLEGAWWMALEADPTLPAYAWERGVVLVTPPTLLATLQTVAHVWRLARQDRDMVELMRLAGGLHDKFVGFVEAFEEVAQRLDQAQGAWRTAQNRLFDGRGSVVSTLHRIGALSGRIRKKLPADWEARALAQSEARSSEGQSAVPSEGGHASKEDTSS